MTEVNKLTLVLSNAVLLAVVLMLVMASTPIPKKGVSCLPIPSPHVARMFGKNALWVNGVVTPAWMPIDQLAPKLAPS